MVARYGSGCDDDEAEFNGMDLAKARAACASIDAVLAGKGGQDG